MSRRSWMRRIRASHTVSLAGRSLLWWPRKRRVAGRRHHLERFLALPLSAAELEYRRQRELRRVDL